MDLPLKKAVHLNPSFASPDRPMQISTEIVVFIALAGREPPLSGMVRTSDTLSACVPRPTSHLPCLTLRNSVIKSWSIFSILQAIDAVLPLNVNFFTGIVTRANSYFSKPLRADLLNETYLIIYKTMPPFVNASKRLITKIL